MKEYSLFLPPDNLAVIGNKNWKKKEAKEYFDWFMQIRNHRVSYFLDFICYDLTDNVEQDLNSISQKLFDTVNTPSFYSIREIDGAKKLNNQGLAIAADMGLFLAQLLENAKPNLYWEIAKGPKTYHSYNLPVLKDFKDGEWDLIFDSIGNIGVSLNLKKAPYNWFERYIYLLNTAK